MSCLLRLCRLALATLAVLSPARADDECGSAPNQMALNECYGGIYQQADAALNAVYRRLATRLAADQNTKEFAALLEDAERAWIAFRDRECAFETATSRGGTIHSMEVAICRTKETRARVKELQRQLACPEGDLTCVR